MGLVKGTDGPLTSKACNVVSELCKDTYDRPKIGAPS